LEAEPDTAPLSFQYIGITPPDEYQVLACALFELGVLVDSPVESDEESLSCEPSASPTLLSKHPVIGIKIISSKTKTWSLRIVLLLIDEK
jgi:hypothetical protein